VRRDLTDVLACPLTGGPLGLVEIEAAGNDVVTGWLVGPAGEFPIVGGVPLLHPGTEKVAARLRAGQPREAEALAFIAGTSPSRLASLIPLLRAAGLVPQLVRRLDTVVEQACLNRAQRTLEAGRSDADAALRLAFLQRHQPNREGYHYFRHRLGLPRHLVALGCLEAASPGVEPIIEVGCGAGHLTWQVAQRFAPRRVIAVERTYALAWLARHHVAPAADVVCADLRHLPVPSSSCSMGVAVDVLSFVTEKASAVRELERVVTPGGGLVLTALINASARHEFAGEPLMTSGWRGLLPDRPIRAHDDGKLLRYYLDGQCPPGHDTDDGRSRTLTILAGDVATGTAGASFESWPHARGRLGPHPLLRSDPRHPGALVLRPPSAGFDRDNTEVHRYLPDHVVLDPDLVDAARRGHSTSALDPLVASVVLLGYPATYPVDPWSDAGLPPVSKEPVVASAR
jgi:SAM-dependent methyltransferase/uncharacterized protein YbaR (Trm112 family)